MPAIEIPDLPDLINLTLAELGEGKMTDLTVDAEFRSMFAMRQLLGPDAYKEDSGDSIQFNVQMNPIENWRVVGLYETDTYDSADTIKQGSVNWSHGTGNYIWDEREFDFNKGRRQILDLIKTRRHAYRIGVAKAIEQQVWTSPASSSVTPQQPLGIPHWVVKNATEGLNGGNPSGFTSGCAGLSASTYPRYQNWTGTYGAISKTDLIRKMRKAAEYTNYESPVQEDSIPSYNKGTKRVIFTNYAVLAALEESLESQNDNLGIDIAPMEGRPTFRKIPITRVGYLDQDTDNPIYGINFGTFYFYVRTGWHFRRSPAMKLPERHTVLAVHEDTSWQTCCYNRRDNWVLYHV